MLWHDSRGIQFPGRDPARTCGQHALLLACPPGFLHRVLFDCNGGPHFIVCSRHSQPLNGSRAACKSQTLLRITCRRLGCGQLV